MEQYLRERQNQELRHRLDSPADQLVPRFMQSGIMMKSMATTIQEDFTRKASNIRGSPAAPQTLPLYIHRSNHFEQKGMSARRALFCTDHHDVRQHAVPTGVEEIPRAQRPRETAYQ